MKTMQVREAKAGLSALIEAAENGEPTTITRHGKPAAVLVSVQDARRIYPDKRPSMVDLMKSFPDDMEFERDRTPMREIDL